jgi:hypothetical protein
MTYQIKNLSFDFQTNLVSAVLSDGATGTIQMTFPIDHTGVPSPGPQTPKSSMPGDMKNVAKMVMQEAVQAFNF